MKKEFNHQEAYSSPALRTFEITVRKCIAQSLGVSLGSDATFGAESGFSDYTE